LIIAEIILAKIIASVKCEARSAELRRDYSFSQVLFYFLFESES